MGKVNHLIVGCTAAALVCILVLLCIISPLADLYIYNARIDGRGITVGEACNEQADVVIMGPSISIYNVNGTLLEQLTNRSVIHAGIGGADSFILNGYAPCVARMQPSVVIYEFIRYDLSSNASPDVYAAVRPYLEIEDAVSAAMPPAQQKLARAHALQLSFYKRKFVMQLANTVAKSVLVRSYSASDYLAIPDDFRGLTDPYPAMQQAMNASRVASLADSMYADEIAGANLPPGDAQLAALTQTLAYFAQRNISVLLVNLPMHPVLDEHLDREQRAATLEQLRALCAVQGCRLLDYEDEFKDERYFIDGLHFSRAGQELFTRQLEEDI